MGDDVRRGCWPWKRKASLLADEPQPEPIYHERRKAIHGNIRRACACRLGLLHSLNNLYQKKTFTRCELNYIACRLDNGGPFSCNCLISPHHNIFTGDYDIYVLERALESRGAEMIFCNQLLGADAYIDVSDPRLIGFILKHGEWHWRAVKKINGDWVDLDSRLDAPITIGDDDAVRQFMSQWMIAGAAQVIRVSEAGSVWINRLP